ncbi:DUF5719 family protein [Streptomyces pathocidini]|uniref:DUF5719 family protein n=1 Tax=Streptomyces pathocidini TaxID=1650571 RepID=A0ABW7UWL0_9ACTN|nr:DUF5719 family protein [Streptomyces pathocidini]
MNRTTQSLIGAAAALAAVTGVAALTGPDSAADASAASAARLPVERSTLLCPAPSSSELAETTYTSFTPKGKGTAAEKGSAELRAALTKEAGAKGGGAKAGKDKPVVALKEPGSPVNAKTSDPEAPALVGTADGALAPGWSAQQTTVISAGGGRAVLGAACTPPDTEFWFPGASTARDRQDYVHLTNPDDSAAVVDLELYGKDGALKAPAGEGITVPAHASVPVLLSTLTTEPTSDAVLHVVARGGRVGASVQASDDKRGGDWLASAADPSGTAVLPGIPKDATSVQLIAMATGAADADLKVRLSGPSGQITPAGHETLNARSGMVTAVDLRDVTKGEPGSLLLTPEGDSSAPFVAALRVTRGKGAKQEIAFIPATAPIETRATAADNRAKGTTLDLVAPGRSAKVTVISSAGSDGGTAATKSYTVKGGTTLSVTPPVPAGAKGSYAVTVVRESGGPVHASRTLELPEGGVPLFTIQTLPDDRGTVEVPDAGQDLSLLTN